MYLVEHSSFEKDKTNKGEGFAILTKYLVVKKKLSLLYKKFFFFLRLVEYHQSYQEILKKIYNLKIWCSLLLMVTKNKNKRNIRKRYIFSNYVLFI